MERNFDSTFFCCGSVLHLRCAWTQPNTPVSQCAGMSDCGGKDVEWLIRLNAVAALEVSRANRRDRLVVDERQQHLQSCTTKKHRQNRDRLRLIQSAPPVSSFFFALLASNFKHFTRPPRRISQGGQSARTQGGPARILLFVWDIITFYPVAALAGLVHHLCDTSGRRASRAASLSCLPLVELGNLPIDGESSAFISKRSLLPFPVSIYSSSGRAVFNSLYLHRRTHPPSSLV